MTMPIKIGTITLKTVSLLLFVLNLAFVCAYATTPSNAATTQMVKMGYEDRFAKGWFAKSGESTGWIGGTEMPIIRCK
jgi:hypothetical protein